MSIESLSWVWNDSRSIGADRLLLICIADEVGCTGVLKSLGLESVCRKANMPIEEAFNCLDRLQALGEIETTETSISLVAIVHRHATRKREPDNRLSGPLARRLRSEIAQRDGWQCMYCSTALAERPPPATGIQQATIDHVVATSQSGSHALENLVLACGPCNSRKGARDAAFMEVIS